MWSVMSVVCLVYKCGHCQWSACVPVANMQVWSLEVLGRGCAMYMSTVEHRVVRGGRSTGCDITPCSHMNLATRIYRHGSTDMNPATMIYRHGSTDMNTATRVYRHGSTDMNPATRIYRHGSTDMDPAARIQRYHNHKSLDLGLLQWIHTMDHQP